LLVGHSEFHVGGHGSSARRLHGNIEMEVIAQKKNTKYNGVRDIREISIRDI
jgi:hypothetical protein